VLLWLMSREHQERTYDSLFRPLSPATEDSTPHPEDGSSAGGLLGHLPRNSTKGCSNRRSRAMYVTLRSVIRPNSRTMPLAIV
jgi:hypothetical protein